MEKSAIYHRVNSEYSYLYNKNELHLRIRTKKGDVKKIEVYYDDTYMFHEKGYRFNKKMKKIMSDEIFDYWQVEVIAPDNRLQYIFILDDILLYGDRGFFENTTENFTFFLNAFRVPYFHENEICRVPEWVKNTIWYQIFPERFRNGNPKISPENLQKWDSSISPKPTDFFGGDLYGVLEKLDYLKELGITGIYFCPIFEAPSNHKYDTVDYYEIDKHFGDKKIFKNLVEESHKRGIKIMLDAVFNHIGITSKFWQDVMKNKEKSKYFDWFHIRDIDKMDYETFAYVKYMPKLNTKNPEVKKYLLDIATYWIKEFDIDAWRLDVANEVDHEFWRDFRKETIKIKEDFYIVGEVWGTGQPWLNGDEYHSIMNYSFTESIKQFFFKEKVTIDKFISDIVTQQMTYRKQTNEVMFNLLDSHDTVRVLSDANNDKNLVKAALTFMFLSVGTPCIYYGTEVGLNGFGDPDCRKVMPWDTKDQDIDMIEFTKELIKLRKNEYNSSKNEFTLKNNDGVLEYINGDIKYMYNSTKTDKKVDSAGKLILLNNVKKLDNLVIKPKGFIVKKI